MTTWRFENIPIEEHQELIEQYRLRNIPIVKQIIAKYEVSPDCVSCDIQELDAWMQHFIKTKENENNQEA